MQKKKPANYLVFVVKALPSLNEEDIKKKKLKDIGINIGLLFQTVDDLIDYRGDSKIVRQTN